MQIDQQLKKAVTTYQHLHAITQAAEVNLTFFGSRIVSVRGYEGKLPLDALTKKMFSLDRDRRYSLQECRTAVACQQKILNLYSIAEEQINNSNNIFTVFHRTIRSCVLWCMPKELAYVLTNDLKRDLLEAPEKGSYVLSQADAFGLYRRGALGNVLRSA